MRHLLPALLLLAMLPGSAGAAERIRGERPFPFTNFKIDQGAAETVAFLERAGRLAAAA
jgi:hypothetical protein